MYSCRPLTCTDLASFRALMRVFAEAFDDVETYEGAPAGDTWVSDLLAKPHFIAVAAFEAGEVVGGLTAYVLDKFERERREIYIYDLAVAARHRRRGIATALIEALRGLARQRGAYVIFVQADLADVPAIALYETLGIKETAHHFDIPVRAAPGVP